MCKSFNKCPQFLEQMGRTLLSNDYSEINNSHRSERHCENNAICDAPVLTVFLTVVFINKHSDLVLPAEH